MKLKHTKDIIQQKTIHLGYIAKKWESLEMLLMTLLDLALSVNLILIGSIVLKLEAFYISLLTFKLGKNVVTSITLKAKRHHNGFMRSSEANTEFCSIQEILMVLYPPRALKSGLAISNGLFLNHSDLTMLTAKLLASSLSEMVLPLQPSMAVVTWLLNGRDLNLIISSSICLRAKESDSIT
jgi:hypothetical protein